MSYPATPDWHSSHYQDHLSKIYNLPSNGVVDLTGYIDCGEFIASGAAGHVFKGKWKESSSVSLEHHALPNVAVKLVAVPALMDAEKKDKRFKRMKREVELWKQLNHRNILPLVGIARMDGDSNRLAFISPWMEHGNVADFLGHNPAFPAVSFLHDIIQGLHFLHTFKPEIIHGDIKAVNVLVNYRKEAYLCDFGLSRFVVDNTLWRTAATQASGTLRWMAPELIEGEVSTSTKASDIYAYGMTCYEILSGKVPFDTARTDASVMKKVLGGERPECIPSRHPGGLWSTITQCWAQNAEERPSTGEALKSVVQFIEGSDELKKAIIDIGKNIKAMAPYPEKSSTEIPQDQFSPSLALHTPSSSIPYGPLSPLATNGTRPSSPVLNSRVGDFHRSSSPSVSAMSRPSQPSPPSQPSADPRRNSPVRPVPPASQATLPSSPKGLPRPSSMLPSRLPRPRGRSQLTKQSATSEGPAQGSAPRESHAHADISRVGNTVGGEETSHPEAPADITVTISRILSSHPARSVDALKKIQKILMIGPEAGPSSPQYLELAEHTEGLIEAITLQMAQVFEHPEDLVLDDNFRLAKQLIQTLSNFCDHLILAESLTVGILTSLLEELTLRLLETDGSSVKKIKDLSRFINMIILRLFIAGRRMSIFRALFALLLQIVKPFPSNGTLPDSKEARVAELVLKCVWKLARNIPDDLSNHRLDPVELFPAIEHFLQSIPPNEWRARETNKVPCGDMPLRTVKVIMQHVVAHHGDDAYDLLSESFDDPSATIVYPYVHRILNSGAKASTNADNRRISSSDQATWPPSPPSEMRIRPKAS